MDTHFPRYSVSYRLTVAPTKDYLALKHLAAELSGVYTEPLPADSAVEICNSALEYSRLVQGPSQELIEEAERAMSVGGAVLRLRAQNKGQFDVFHSYCEELLSMVHPDCPDEGLDLQ